MSLNQQWTSTLFLKLLFVFFPTLIQNLRQKAEVDHMIDLSQTGYKGWVWSDPSQRGCFLYAVLSGDLWLLALLCSFLGTVFFGVGVSSSDAFLGLTLLHCAGTKLWSGLSSRPEWTGTLPDSGRTAPQQSPSICTHLLARNVPNSLPLLNALNAPKYKGWYFVFLCLLSNDLLQKTQTTGRTT